MKELALQLPGGNIINVGLDLAVIAAIFVCLFMLILGGFGWIFSQGDKQKVAQARQRLAFSIIGLILVFTSFMIITIIYTFFGVTVNIFK
jgi:cbb3-type cytochrome oxidase subunit 3